MVTTRLTPSPTSREVTVYLARIEEHLVRVAQGHDIVGHLFAVERLARAARAAWWADHPGGRDPTGR
jgi:hypothetical protein